MTFDWRTYGALLRKARRNFGYRSCEKAVLYVREVTGRRIHGQTLRRYEEGVRIAESENFMALNIAFLGHPFPPVLTKLIRKEEE